MVQSSVEPQTTEALGYAAEGKKFAEDNVLPDISLRQVGKFVAEMTPILGDAMAAKEVWDEATSENPNWLLVGALGGATVVGLIPGVGDAAAKLIKKGAREALGVAKRIDVDTSSMGSGLGNVSLKPKDNTTFQKLETDLPPAENSAKTQIAGTLPTYKKADTLLTEMVGEGKTLDFGAGLGMSKKELGFDTYEPYPKPDFKPDFVSPNEIPSNSYKKITNLNVLNVVPRDVRDSIVNDIGRVLEPDGRAIITTRGSDVMKAKGKDGPEPMSIITSANTYQKGFTQPELRSYITDTLGEGFNVVNNKLGAAGVTVHKLPTKNFKEGGAVMEDTSNDMDAMLLEEQVDPVSGNTAPLGALPAEVRDDIEVNVSPNEFVVNAATVRYFGQEFFDNLQDTAEDGWERIAANDDLPFRDDELEFEETEDALEDENLPKRSFAEGDIVEATGEQAEGYENVPDAVGGGYGGYGGSGQSYMGYDRKPYTNEDGKEIVVYFYNGRPLSKIPEGYTEVGVTEGGGGAVGTAVTEAITEVEQKKDRDGSTQWARDIGVMEGASNEEVFRAMDMSPDGTKLNDGYWNRDPEGWNSSDWSNYNESLNSGFKIPGTDIKINAAEAVFDSISVLAGVPGYIFGASMKLGKQNLAKKANEWAKNALKNNFKSTTVDQRTILDTAYSTGVMLGEIAESVSQLEWAKKTYNIVKLPEVDQAKVDERRGPNPNLGYGWTKGLNGEQLASAIDLHNNYSKSHQIDRGMASIDINGRIIGSKAGTKTDGGFQQGLFEGSNGIVMRYTPPAAISSNYATNVFQDIGYEVRLDAQGNAYYMAGTSPFNQQKIMVPQGAVSTNGDAIKLQAAKDAEAEAIANQAAKDAEAEAIANQATKDAEAEAIANQAVSVAPVVASTPRVYAGDVSSPVTSITSQRKTATDKANERAQQSNAERKAAASKSYNTRKAAEKKNESAAKDAGLTRGIGGQYGRAEGGLVQKPKKK